MKYLISLFIICFVSVLGKAQPSFEQMKAKFEARIPALDSMSSTPDDYNLKFEEIYLTTRDSIQINVWDIYQESKQTIILVHGFNMNKSHMLNRAKNLFDQGYNIVLIDLRARGFSGGEKASTGIENSKDIECVVNWTRQNYPQCNLTLYGFSHGGRAILFASSQLNVDQIILEGTPYILANGFERHYGYKLPIYSGEADLNNCLTQLNEIPILLLIGENDSAITPSEAEELLKYHQNSEDILMIAKDTKHHVFNNDNQEQILNLIHQFIQN